MNILVLDIGNTKIKLYIENNNKKLYKEFFRVPQLIKYLNNLQIKDYNVIISDVRNIKNKIQQSTKKAKNLIILNNDIKLPIKIDYKTPKTLGSDRVAAAVGAYSNFGNIPLLVVNSGTAITIDVIDCGTFKGGVISPGIITRFKALYKFTGKLPLITKFTDSQITFPAKSTESCIISGVIHGIVNELNAYIDDFNKKHINGKVILTGGDCFILEKYIKKPIFVEKFLTIHGLVNILKMNV